MTISYLPLSWDLYLSQIHTLAEKILSLPDKPQEIVAISRGGLTIGHILSDMLRLPIWTISIQSYSDLQNQGEIKILGKLQTSIKNKHVLLVDDVSDTGKTFVRAMEYLNGFKPTNITTCAAYYKPHSVYKPDVYAAETDKWILFPYEPIESITVFVKKLQKEGKDKKEIIDFLHSLTFTDRQIEFVYKYYVK